MKEKDSLPSKVTEAEKDLFENVKTVLDTARGKAYAAVNSAMVEAYWNVGKLIFEKQGGAERAEYGDGLIKRLAKMLTAEFGRGFDERNLWNMRRFYTTFPIVNALRSELSRTHYRLILKVENSRARVFYINGSAEGNRSTRQAVM